jgi:hypothetical protein
MRTTALRSYAGLVLGLMLFGPRAAAAAGASKDYTAWTGGAGNWAELARWSDGLPNPLQRTEVHGTSAVVVPAGTYIAGDLEVGMAKGDRASVQVDGGQLILMQDSLRIGEYTGGQGEFILTSGALHTFMDVYVGAANGVAGRATKADLLIKGGSFLGRSLYVGSGWGAESTLSIVGSKAAAVHVLNCVYIQGLASENGQAGTATLSLTLDEQGVTPITIQSRYDGLRVIKDEKSHCRLVIGLAAVPPREDVTLVAAHMPAKGTFDDLPEGSEIMAQHGGRTYRWQLTYRGGAGGNDLVLKNKSTYTADVPVTHARPIPEPPKPLWSEHRVYPLSSELAGKPAFPGAEGFGACAAGGRGGRTIDVDNLNDSGPGSLRQAVETSGPRTIAFRVGGVIAMKSTLAITEPFLTVDGSTAPGAGILLRNHGIEVRTHDVVLRYLRVRVGDDAVHLDDPKSLESYKGGSGEHALYFIEGSSNCIADHLSLSWSTTKICSVTKLSDLITIQWCILSEGLNFAGHGYASIAGGNRVTWHHNLLAHNQSRNVLWQGMVDSDFRNNVIYDWGDTAGYGEFDRLNYIGNVLKPGPSTRKEQRLFHDGVDLVMPGTLYLAGNILEGNDKASQDNWLGVGYDRASIDAQEPFPAAPVTTEPARTAYEHVLQDAGATLPRRDAVDRRIVREVRGGTGHIIDWVKDAGGWPEFPFASSSLEERQEPRSKK